MRTPGGLLVVLALLAACAKSDAAHAGATGETTTVAVTTPGSIEGDVFLMMQSGDAKRGSGLTVALLRNSDSLQTITADACASFWPTVERSDRRIKAVEDSMREYPTAAPLIMDHARPARDAVIRASREMRSKIDGAIAREVLDTTGTGIGAHYRFDKVPPGRYLLFARWPMYAKNFAFLAPVEVKPGQTLKRDLDNSAESADHLYCEKR